MPATSIDNIDAYVRDINQYRLVGREEERRLALQARSSDPASARAARDQLVCANLRLVVKIAHTFKQYDLPLSDLVAEGNIGLIRAAEKYDPDNGAKFSVYAAWWIKQAMRVAVAERTRTVRIPRNSGLRLIHVHRARARWIAEHGTEPTACDLAGLTGLREDAVERLLRAPDRTVSINAHTDEGDDTSPTYDAVLSDSSDGQAERRERRALVGAALDELSDLDRELLSGMYWCDGEPRLPDVALRTGLSVAAAKARLADALSRLRGALASEATEAAYG